MPRTPVSARPACHPVSASDKPAGTQDREREIARLVGLWPYEIADVSPEGRARLIRKLALVLKAERLRGRAGHWSYDLARHAALVRVLRREQAALEALCPKIGAPHKAAARCPNENARTSGPRV
ncbi:hypothetical protein [Hyphomicrobium sp. LHD-15]|uniref:hypothetical protein n=1 Tax=Hyphomicrobium sp. LHD-15 TaxID=3072142 RepID=UPI00280FED7C|nr:hypothetical protein [Hyphomicrobium sp. LHD-15]MDQ8697271.1 hypothetical protein [Hyphomicrobium sp. LHD-15]